MILKSNVSNILLRFVGHIFFWIVVYFFFNYFLGYGSEDVQYVNLFSWFLMPVTIAVSYFVIYFLLPRYLFKNKFKTFLLYLLYTFILATNAIVLSILYALTFLEAFKEENTTPITKTIPLIVLGVFFVVLVMTSIYLILYNYNSQVRNEDLKNKILQAQLQLKDQELKYLKMQIHPHFLFNSLNAIYGMALAKKEQTPEVILKLSSLLDYILYQVQKPEVSLADELKHIQDYIELERVRFSDTLEVDYQENLESFELKISPMLLLPFVENSFKHGAKIKGKLKIDIQVDFIDNCLTFSVANTAKKTNINSDGIGLENIYKRLEMLYPNQFNLKTEFQEDKFLIDLNIFDLK